MGVVSRSRLLYTCRWWCWQFMILFQLEFYTFCLQIFSVSSVFCMKIEHLVSLSEFQWIKIRFQWVLLNSPSTNRRRRCTTTNTSSIQSAHSARCQCALAWIFWSPICFYFSRNNTSFFRYQYHVFIDLLEIYYNARNLKETAYHIIVLISFFLIEKTFKYTLYSVPWASDSN